VLASAGRAPPAAVAPLVQEQVAKEKKTRKKYEFHFSLSPYVRFVSPSSIIFLITHNKFPDQEQAQGSVLTPSGGGRRVASQEDAEGNKGEFHFLLSTLM
jgi:hypothetical protein